MVSIGSLIAGQLNNKPKGKRSLVGKDEQKERDVCVGMLSEMCGAV